MADRPERGGFASAVQGGQEPTHLRAPDAAVRMVSISDLVTADSPRSESESIEHARVLAESGTELPPVIVHASTMRLIDGAHRVRAALIRGESEVAARFFDGSERDAFALAVAANVQHGLPLTRKERTDAAARVFASHPHWSDRAVASVTGLSAHTIGRIRRRATVQGEQLHDRVGLDGRLRPLNSAENRLLAAEYLTTHPQASLREVAAASGLSPGTVRDVRRRLQCNEDPVPPAQRRAITARAAAPKTAPTSPAAPAPTGPAAPAPSSPAASAPATAGAPAEPPRAEEQPDARTTPRTQVQAATPLSALRRDPSLRHSETGRLLLRLLDNRLLSEAHGDELIEGLPPHSLGNVAAAARECARLWAEFSNRLDRRK
ncbi:ParB/RepB/Spo0J family partition protein [Streptomyces sp. RKAG290]|uniref:ParB/RepB/Spo0J family partition protein n=1 Tax=Streptomyces sp. RKAG290 TaxID=2888348 RepID=UPI002033788F|nr:ParB/RepB/Spo0J family partition protein [Streptomyces sp. RKAG290]MCM2416256.1 ParB N-terminal domain-containing protein [Streptomyces sp. RKAG290]